MMKQKHFFRNMVVQLGLAAGTILGLLILGEVALRIINLRSPVYELEMLRYALELKQPMESSLATHRHRPNVSTRLLGVDFSLNSRGYRGKDFAIPKPSKTIRLLILGDSNTVGWGVPLEKVFTSVLESKINSFQPFGLRPFEFLNAGVGNYPILSQYGLFLSDYKTVQPDLVVIQFSPMDVRRVIQKKKTWLSHSFALALLQSKLAYLSFQAPTGFEEALAKDMTANLSASLEIIAKMHAEAKAAHIPLVVMIRPEIHDLSIENRFVDSYAKIESFLQARGILAINLFPAFHNKYANNERQLWVGEKDYHFNERAHALMAELFYDYLLLKNPLGLKTFVDTTREESPTEAREMREIKKDRP